jgi:hypothetical protein
MYSVTSISVPASMHAPCRPTDRLTERLHRPRRRSAPCTTAPRPKALSPVLAHDLTIDLRRAPVSVHDLEQGLLLP